MKKLFTILFIALLSFQINGQCWQAVSGGMIHTLAIKIDGTLWAWGNNSNGQLGNGTQGTITVNVPTQIGTATNWKIVFAGGGGAFSLAIKTDGTLWAWGNNSMGQLGNGTQGTVTINVPTQIGTATNWQSLSGGYGHALAIKTDGTLWAWGWNWDGQMGDGTIISKNIPTQIGTATNWQSLSGGNGHSLAIKTDGTLWAWGSNSFGQLGDGTIINKNIPTKIGAATNWKSLSGGFGHVLAIKTDGTLWAWGYNSNGQVGDATTIDKNTPLQIGPSTNWKSITGGFEHSLAIKTDGTLWGWGDDFYSELAGAGSYSAISTPTQIGSASDWQYADGGDRNSLAIKTDGTLWAWGYNLNGVLGDGTNTDKYMPTKINCTPNGIEEISANKNFYSIYPNPAANDLYIKNLNNKFIDKIIIFDITGRKILEQKENVNQINIEHLENGMYQLQVFSEGKSYSQKFIKE